MSDRPPTVLTQQQWAALLFDRTLMFAYRGWKIDPWQRRVLESRSPRLLLNCARQAGKSTVVAALALHTALFENGSLVLVVAPKHGQAKELLRQVEGFYKALRYPVARQGAENQDRLELVNGSRIETLPAVGDTIRGYSGVNLLIVDEAARVPDDIYRAVCPMLAASRGRLVCLSTPAGRRGFFYRVWQDRQINWERIEIPAAQAPRLSREAVAEYRRIHGDTAYRQEYECSFETVEGLVYPEFEQCLVEASPPPSREWVGGIDFGSTSPTAAVWGFRDLQDVFWVVGEYFARSALLKDIAAALPRQGVMWYADPQNARERRELLAADFKIREADNAVDPGIQAVRARIRTGRLKVVRSACPNLIYESQLYRYAGPDDNVLDRTKPIKDNDHAMDALRYLILRLDEGYLIRPRKVPPPSGPPANPSQLPPQDTERRKWLNYKNEALWTRLE